jgi:ATP-dependent Clp protease adaptor protein ClpS
MEQLIKMGVTQTTPTPSDLVGTGTIAQTALAPMYWVVMHDDPITTMKYVIEILVDIFDYDRDHAFETMYAIHVGGMAKIACLPLEHAETKVGAVHINARLAGFPLTCTLEEDPR